jgi:hypothetical protein
MSQNWMPYVAAGMILVPMAGALRAQSATPHDAWLMRNYRFVTPPPPSKFKPVDPVLTELYSIQDTVRMMLRRAKSEGDYESALAAADLAISNAQLIGAVTEQQQAAPSMKSAAEAARLPMPSPAPFVLIALSDKTINAATSYWVDGVMLNYITLQGVHGDRAAGSGGPRSLSRPQPPAGCGVPPPGVIPSGKVSPGEEAKCQLIRRRPILIHPKGRAASRGFGSDAGK